MKKENKTIAEIGTKKEIVAIINEIYDRQGKIFSPSPEAVKLDALKIYWLRIYEKR